MKTSSLTTLDMNRESLELRESRERLYPVRRLSGKVQSLIV